jgi:hypothetical protein
LVALLAATIALWAGVELGARLHMSTPTSKVNDVNPNRFYLYATGKEFLVRYTYDPHAADLWMFQTAEGHLMVNESKSRTGSIPNTKPTE